MRKKLVLISTKAITVNTFLDQLLIDLKKNFNIKVYVSDPKNIKISCNKSQINFPSSFLELFNIFSLFKTLNQIKKIIEKNHPKSEIFVHTPLAAHLVRIALFFNKTKVVYFVHGFRFHKQTNILNYIIFAAIEILLKYKTKYYFVINQEDKFFVKKILKKKYYFINGIGINLKKRFINNKFKNKKNLTVGVIAAYRENKGYKDLFHIADNLKKENIIFKCFGYGSKNAYEKKISRMGLKEKIKLFNFKKNIEIYIAKFDILLHASYREGLPISVLQTLYHKVPVIGRNTRGLYDLVKNKKYGYLVDKNFITKVSYLLKMLTYKRNIILKFRRNISKIDFKKYSKKKISLQINKILKINYEV